MLVNLETLLVLHKQGTMARTSSRLRISQSAVSKRIAAIEDYYGGKLIERSGRNVILTAEALSLVEKTGPMLSEIREALNRKKGEQEKRVVLGVSESILSSWGAQQIDPICKKEGIDVVYHCHRSPVVLEKVEAGIYDLGICSGKVSNVRGLFSEALRAEEMVLVSQSSKLFKQGDVLSIEKTSATWKAIKESISRRGIKPVEELESFFSIAQLARSGHGVGLVPIGVAKALGFEKKQIVSIKPKVSRPIQLVYKKSKLERPYLHDLITQLKGIRV